MLWEKEERKKAYRSASVALPFNCDVLVGGAELVDTATADLYPPAFRPRRLP